MSAQSSPIGIDLSPAAQERHSFALESWPRLQHFAYRALNVRGKRNNEEVVVCIKVDTNSRYLVDMLMPGADWQQYRDLEQEPVARGCVSFGTCEHLAEVLPDIASVLMEVPEAGKMKCVALDDGGCTVYDIDPVEQK